MNILTGTCFMMRRVFWPINMFLCTLKNKVVDYCTLRDKAARANRAVTQWISDYKVKLRPNTTPLKKKQLNKTKQTKKKRK